MSSSADVPFNSDNAATDAAAALVVAPTPTADIDVVAPTLTTPTNEPPAIVAPDVPNAAPEDDSCNDGKFSPFSSFLNVERR